MNGFKYQPRDKEELADIVKCARNQFVKQNISFHLSQTGNFENWFIYFFTNISGTRIDELLFSDTNSRRYTEVNSDAFYRLLVLNEFP